MPSFFAFLKPLFCSLLVFVFVGAQAVAKAPVWKVSKGDNYLYLGGTIHLLSKNDYPLPEAFEKAYSDSSELWFETDSAELMAPETQVKMLSVMMYQDTRSLSTVLSRDTYEALSKLMEDRELSMAVFEKFTPAGIMFTLTALELQRLGLIDQSAGVDLHFSQRATKDGKERLHLEKVDEQIAFMNRINELDPNKLIESTIKEINNASATWQELLQAWRTGDMSLMNKTGIAQMKSEYPKIYEFLLVDRNEDWFDDIEKMMKSPDVEFVLVGALHMAGEYGLLEALRKADYTIEQLN